MPFYTNYSVSENTQTTDTTGGFTESFDGSSNSLTSTTGQSYWEYLSGGVSDQPLIDTDNNYLLVNGDKTSLSGIINKNSYTYNASDDYSHHFKVNLSISDTNGTDDNEILFGFVPTTTTDSNGYVSGSKSGDYYTYSQSGDYPESSYLSNNNYYLSVYINDALNSQDFTMTFRAYNGTSSTSTTYDSNTLPASFSFNTEQTHHLYIDKVTGAGIYEINGTQITATSNGFFDSNIEYTLYIAGKNRDNLHIQNTIPIMFDINNNTTVGNISSGELIEIDSTGNKQSFSTSNSSGNERYILSKQSFTMDDRMTIEFDFSNMIESNRKTNNIRFGFVDASYNFTNDSSIDNYTSMFYNTYTDGISNTPSIINWNNGTTYISSLDTDEGFSNESIKIDLNEGSIYTYYKDSNGDYQLDHTITNLSNDYSGKNFKIIVMKATNDTMNSSFVCSINGTIKKSTDIYSSSYIAPANIQFESSNSDVVSISTETFNSTTDKFDIYVKYSDIGNNDMFAGIVSDDYTGSGYPTTSEKLFRYLFNTGEIKYKDASGFTQLEKLTASNAGGNAEYFGLSLSISNDGKRIVTGAYGYNSNRGSVYIYDLSGNTWVETIIVSSESDEIDYFGGSVSMSGDGTRIAVSASRDSGNTGCAYIFDLSGGSWEQTDKLTASDGTSGDYFGYPLCISNDGTTVIIGAYSDDSSKGSAYIFDLSGGMWVQTDKLIASDGASGDQFGYSVSISGDGTTAIIGALRDNNGNGVYSGSAYIFDLSGGSWVETQKLISDDSIYYDYFGKSVSISRDGSTVIIGAQIYNNSFNAGGAYVFNLSNNLWTQTQKLTADDGASYDYFGSTSVYISSNGTKAVIGAYGDDDNGSSSGSAYIFDLSGGSWVQTQKLTASDGTSSDYFGYSVYMSDNGNIIGIGAYGDNLSLGSMYVYSDDITSRSSDGSTSNTIRMTFGNDQLTFKLNSEYYETSYTYDLDADENYKVILYDNNTESSFTAYSTDVYSYEEKTALSSINYINTVQQYFTLASGAICFYKDTPVMTDQGEIKIQDITNKNTIDGQKVVAVTKLINKDKHMVLIKKDAIDENIPSRDTYISQKHIIYFNNNAVKAKRLINNDTIVKVKMESNIIYNVLLPKYSKMNVNNLSVETLHPKNKNARSFFDKINMITL